jgi:hypothetical protein
MHSGRGASIECACCVFLATWRPGCNTFNSSEIGIIGCQVMDIQGAHDGDVSGIGDQQPLTV